MTSLTNKSINMAYCVAMYYITIPVVTSNYVGYNLIAIELLPWSCDTAWTRLAASKRLARLALG